MTTGTGTKRRLAFISVLKEAGKPNTFLEFDTTSMMPKKIDCVPSVMINGCSPVLLTSVPLIHPIAVPARMHTKIAAPTGIPATMSFAAIMPVNPATAPTDRSMPAIKIAKNSPRLNNMFTALCRKICTMLDGVNTALGFIIVRIIIKSKNIPIVPYRCHSILKCCKDFSFFVLSFILYAPLCTLYYSPVATFMIFSCVASLFVNSFRIFPPRNTQIRSHTESSSVKSEETMMTPLPSSASRRMRI